MSKVRLRMEAESQESEELPGVQSEVEEYKTCKRGHLRSPENVGNTRGCKICKKIAEKRRQVENREKTNECSKRWRDKNPEKTKELNRRKIKNISDSYISNANSLKVSDLTPEFIELYRLNLTLKREIRKCNQSKP